MRDNYKELLIPFVMKEMASDSRIMKIISYMALVENVNYLTNALSIAKEAFKYESDFIRKMGIETIIGTIYWKLSLYRHKLENCKKEYSGI